MANGSSEKSQLPPDVKGMTGADELPSYEQSYPKHLVEDEEGVRRLFGSVAVHLETMPKIGNTDLSFEWGQLENKYKTLYRDSQLNANQCANFLKSYSSVLVPLSKSTMTTGEKTLMIETFIKDIPKYENAAEKISDDFGELAKLVEVFPVKVTAYLRAQVDNHRFWTGLWSSIKGLCTTIWAALTSVANTFGRLLSRVRNIRVCVPFANFSFELTATSNVSRRHDSPVCKSAADKIEDDCKALSGRLTKFENAWRFLQLECDILLQRVQLASNMSSVLGSEVLDACLENARTVHGPLVQYLSAYAHGKAPL